MSNEKMTCTNGIICVNKPQDFTSFDVVAKMRGMAKIKRCGHAGTLDPMATGVLPIFFGTATRACDILPDGDKRYTASFKLGVTTDTLDITGKVLSQRESGVTKEQIVAVLDNFRGEIEQVPPMFSAVQVGGQRLYDLARQGIEVERKPRKVNVFLLELLNFDEKTQSGQLDIKCSRGTYIRSIIADMGECLGSGAIMTGLVRTQAAGFSLDDCITLEQAQELTNEGTLLDKILPIDRVFADYPKIYLCQAQSRMFLNGVKLDLNRVKFKHENTVHTVYSDQKEFMGLAVTDTEKMELIIYKMFMLKGE